MGTLNIAAAAQTTAVHEIYKSLFKKKKSRHLYMFFLYHLVPFVCLTFVLYNVQHVKGEKSVLHQNLSNLKRNVIQTVNDCFENVYLMNTDHI